MFASHNGISTVAPRLRGMIGKTHDEDIFERFPEIGCGGKAKEEGEFAALMSER